MAVFNIEAEQYYLGCLLLDGGLIEETDIRSEHLYSEKHRVLFNAIMDLQSRNQIIDLPSVVMQLGSDLDRAGGITYLADLSGSIPSVLHFKHYEGLILDAWRLRQAQNVAVRLQEEVREFSDTVPITNAIASLSALEEGDTDVEETLDETLAKMLEQFEQDTGLLTGIDTGFSELNAMTNGFQDGDLIILGARPSVGKTAFALNVGSHSAANNTVVSIFSLEMSKESLLRRIISAVGMIDASKMKNPKHLFEDDDWPKLSLAMSSISQWPLHIYDESDVTVRTIRSKLRKLHKMYPDKKHICIIDYLQLIQTTGNGNRTEELGEISRSLKKTARKFEQPIIVLSQLSRAVENRQNKRPMLSDLRESGNIEQDADVIGFLYRDDYYDAETERKNIVELQIAKQRNGPTGMIELVFLKNYNKFVNLERPHADQVRTGM